MTSIHQIYKCATCGIVVEVLHEGEGELVCCEQPMKLMQENTVDASKEKHVPVIEKTDDKKTLVKVGEVEHPMTEEHHIEWIELDNLEKNKVCKKFLKPGEKPESKFCCDSDCKARAYCNLHGLWKSVK